MSDVKESELLSLLNPDLFTVEELIEKITSRCIRIKNLRTMTKEELVGLFRQIILPYPQRVYRTNRRGKMLISRRTNASLESHRNEERSWFSNDRLKPPPDLSEPKTIDINSQNEKKPEVNSVLINDRRKCTREDPERRNYDKGSLSSGRNFFLKRPFGYEKSTPSSQAQSKRPRTAIRWP